MPLAVTESDHYGAPYGPEGALAEELELTHQQFNSLNTDQKNVLDPYAAMLMGNEMIHVAGNMRPSEYLASSDDAVLTEFLHRHHAYLDMQRADPYLKDAFAYFKSGYVNRLQKGIQEGWVSDDAREISDVISNVSLEIGDIRDTRLVWEMGHFYGYNNSMVIAQGIRRGDYRQEVVENLRDTVPHELSHRFSRWLSRWASEAFAEQLGMVVQHGQPEVFRADLRAHEKSAYYNAETALMHTLLTEVPSPNADLPLLALRAFTSESPDSDEWKLFHVALDSAWGTKDAFQKVNTYVDGLEKSVAVEHADWDDFQVWPEASTRARYALLHNQTRIFGNEYKPSGRHRREELPQRVGKTIGRHRRA